MLVEPARITPEETECLQLLAWGMTVHDLAEKTGYSEWAMFRFLAGPALSRPDPPPAVLDRCTTSRGMDSASTAAGQDLVVRA
jgi:hypothetical protein